MDNEDGGNSHPEGSWQGAWTIDGNANSWHTICKVDGRLFKFLHLTPSTANGGPYNRSTNYALIRLGNLPPIQRYFNDPFILYHDNEDSNNKNLSQSGQSGSNSYLNRTTQGTTLQFWISYGNNNRWSDDPAYMHEFPSLGFEYGVFGTEMARQSSVLANGALYIDDENRKNANSFKYLNIDQTPLPGLGVDRTTIGPSDTYYRFMKVR
ncbi:hypothetical protein [Dyadobacter tibetensis]|uniref:hypothetical protein n=1 Tax=Dyadobacter tibetensis TaxID=1211851 RepID=UPI00046EA428|nr:hypothetical protein [Dyadobacter tibetensis]